MKNFSITNIDIVPVCTANGLVAFVGLELNNALYLGGIAIHERLDGTGLRLTYPTKRAGHIERNLYHPLTKELSKALEMAIFDEYKRLYM